jgi:protein-tyrosine phosphatase
MERPPASRGRPAGRLARALIDLHCHILPALDDGARDLDDALGMARQAQADGIAAVCATPHVRHDHAVEIHSLAGRVAALQGELDERGIAVRVLPGGELAQTSADALSDGELRAIALGGAGGWVLLEPAPGPIDVELLATVRRLAERGLRCVVAHPERHAGPAFEDHLAALAAAGCLIQWTAAFVVAPEARDYLLGLARRGLVHVLGSDAHSSRAGRPVALAAAFAALGEALAPAAVDWIARAAPEAIVAGQSPPAAPW